MTLDERKGDVVFDTDEFPRLTSLEKLAALKPAFRENGSVTAGNASGRNDGASALLIMTREKAAELGLKPLAVVRQVASAALDPSEWFLVPVPAVRKILEDQRLSLKDFGLIEMNEASAGQCIGCMRLLDFDQELLDRRGDELLDVILSTAGAGKGAASRGGTAENSSKKGGTEKAESGKAGGPDRSRAGVVQPYGHRKTAGKERPPDPTADPGRGAGNRGPAGRRGAEIPDL